MCGDRRGGALRALLRLARRSSTSSRCRHFIDRNFDSPLDLACAAAARARPGAPRRRSAGWPRSCGRYFDDERLRRIFSFQSMYAGLAPYEALALYAVITYMDTVNGVFVPDGRHARPARRPRRRGREGRRVVPLRRPASSASCSPTARRARCGACAWPAARSSSADAVVGNPDLPVAYRTLLPGHRRCRVWPGAGDYSPSALVWHVGVRGDLPPGTAHHNIHFGRDWDGAFRAILRRRRPHAGPVAAGHRADARRAGDGARRRATCSTCSSRCPNLDGQVDWTRERSRARDDLARPPSTGSATRTDVEVEELVDPLDWEAQGMERGTPFALSHTFLQTGPFRPGNLERRAPGPGVRRVGHGARRRRADGAGVGQARGRARRGDGRRR